jgi:hypothetical protein
MTVERLAHALATTDDKWHSDYIAWARVILAAHDPATPK